MRIRRHDKVCCLHWMRFALHPRSFCILLVQDTHYLCMLHCALMHETEPIRKSLG